MPKPALNPHKVVVFSGAGISAPSGIPTYRGGGGLWYHYRIEDVATTEAWVRQPAVLLEFYNERRAQVASAFPNNGHIAVARLGRRFEVVVITQNVDDPHERAGSSRVIHLHGQLNKARSTADPSRVYHIGDSPIHMGDQCELGSQLRPHIVLFGEEIMNFAEARAEILSAGKFIIAGTSLAVFPAAALVKHARFAAEKFLVDINPRESPFGFKRIVGSADVVLPRLAEEWLTNSGRVV
ncbi:MAG: NAD-dependent protein deacetylase, family [Chthoniobacteraceae bacterium]|nr:NAD-dependent protein deacetylase, family [Chthoniobacteraceae bacterium]